MTVNYVKHHWRILLMILIGIGMFFIYSWFPIESSKDLYICGASPLESRNAANSMLQAGADELCEEYGSAANIHKFNSPDEMMNFFWTSRLANGEALTLDEPLEEVGNNLIRPRSVNVIDATILPGSFLGLPFVYGSVGKIFSGMGLPLPDVLWYLTAFFAVIATLFFYQLVRMIFNRNVALISGILMYVFPGWVYYTSRSFYHNVLFVSFAIIGLYFLFVALQQVSRYAASTRWNHWFGNLVLFTVAGLMTGAALITRSSEAGWLGLVTALVLLFHWRQFFPTKQKKFTTAVLWHHWFGISLFVIALLAAFLPVFVTNYQLYGAPLSIGYGTSLSGDITEIVHQSGLLFKLLVSPFGVDLQSILINAYNYLLVYFWYFSIPALLGIVLWFFTKGRTSRKQQAYLLVFALMTVYLGIYYGSWEITDRIDEQTVSIGTSYIRYWLPIYLGLIPFVGYAVNWLLGLIHFQKWAKPIIAGLVIGLMAFLGFRLIFWDSDESLLAINNNVHAAQAELLRIKQYVPQDAIIVFGFKQADKIFFPEYSRIIPELAVSRDYEAVALLVKHAEVYYYHFAEPEVVETISRRNFEPYGIRINSQGQKVFQRDWLYRIELITDEE